MPRFRAIAGLGLAVALLGTSPRASAAAPAEDPATSGPRCPSGEQGAIAELACEIATALGAASRGAAVAVGAVRSDRTVSRGPELSLRIAQAIAGKLEGARLLPGTPGLAEARGAAAPSTALVFVDPEIAGGTLRIVAGVYPVTRGFWERLKTPASGPTARAFAARRLDGEVGSFLPQVPLVADRVERFAAPTTDVVAVACGDGDGDGALEIAIVGRRKIALGRLRSGRFAPFAEAQWAALSPVAPSPLREPMGAARFVTGRGLDVGITDRASGFRLSPDLSVVEKLDAPIPWTSVGCLSRTGIAVGLPGPCRRGAGAGLDMGEVTDADAVAGGIAVGASGAVRTVAAYRSAAARAAMLRDGEGRTATLTDAGAALAVGDVDRDGEPEVVTSIDTPLPAGDAVVIRSFGADGTTRERLRVPVAEGVRAVSLCPPEDDRQSALVVATNNGLWLVRAAQKSP